MTSANSNLRGIVAMMFSSFMFVIGDLLMKLSSDGLPTGEIIFLRGVFMSVPVAAVLVLSGRAGEARVLTSGRVWLRTFADVVGTGAYLPALFQMPLGNSIVLRQIGPIVMVALGAFLLRESVGWRRWLAVIVGFIGVVIVARPGVEGFNVYSLLILLAVAATCARDVVTRMLPAGVSGLLLIAASGFAGMPAGALIGWFEQWSWPSQETFALIAASTTALIGGHYTVIYAIRTADFSAVSPFRYTVIPYAILCGYLVWGDIPDTLMVLGTAVIFAAGLYLVHIERSATRLARARGTP